MAAYFVNTVGVLWLTVACVSRTGSTFTDSMFSVCKLLPAFVVTGVCIADGIVTCRDAAGDSKARIYRQLGCADPCSFDAVSDAEDGAACAALEQTGAEEVQDISVVHSGDASPASPDGGSYSSPGTFPSLDGAGAFASPGDAFSSPDDVRAPLVGHVPRPTKLCFDHA